MNLTKCIDSEIGTMIAAYELELLTDEENIDFEQHLLKCDYCFNEVETFENSAIALKSNSAVKTAVALKVNSMRSMSRFLESLKTNLWPEVPFLLTPAVLLIFITILVYPAWNGLNSPSDFEIGNIEIINLVPMRSSSGITQVSQAKSLIINFVFQNAIPGKKYTLVLVKEKNDIIYYQESFRGFDKFGSASLLIPASRLSSGNYELKITDPDTDTQLGQQTYYFGLSFE